MPFPSSSRYVTKASRVSSFHSVGYQNTNVHMHDAPTNLVIGDYSPHTKCK